MNVTSKLICVLFVGILTQCNADVYKVTNSAMYPNVIIGNHVEITKAHQYTYDDLVVIEGMLDWIQFYRVVALPGDTIEIKDHICIINNEACESRFVKKAHDPDGYEVNQLKEILPDGKERMIYVKPEADTLGAIPNARPMVVPPNNYYVLGDYRSASMDSREIGFIPYKNIKGKVVRIIK